MDDNEETTLISFVKPLSFLNRGKQVIFLTQLSINPEGFFHLCMHIIKRQICTCTPSGKTNKCRQPIASMDQSKYREQLIKHWGHRSHDKIMKV